MSDDFPYPELLGRTVADPKTDREHLEAIVVAADKVRMHMVAGNYHYTDFTDFGDLLKAAKHHIESHPNNSDGVTAASRECHCDDCDRDYIVWFAPNELWNAVMRPNGEVGDEPFLCASCFAIRADAAGIEHTGFLLTATTNTSQNPSDLPGDGE